MRKSQEKIIERAKKENYKPEYITILSDESRTIKELQQIFELLLKHQNETINVQDIEWILNYINCKEPEYASYICRIIGISDVSIYKFIEIMEIEKDMSIRNFLFITESWCRLAALTFQDVKKLYQKQNAFNCVCDFCWEIASFLYLNKKEYTYTICEDMIDLLYEAHKYNFDLTPGTAYSYVKNNISKEVLIKNQFNYEKICMEKAKNTFPNTMNFILSKTGTNAKHAYVYEKQTLDTFNDLQQHITSPMDITIKSNPYVLLYSTSLSGLSIKIQYGKASVLSVKNAPNNKLSASMSINFNKNVSELLFTYDNMIYSKIKNRWIPFNLKQLMNIKDNEILQVAVEEYIDKQIQSGHHIWKDLQKYIMGDYKYLDLPSISINEILKYHTIDEMMKSHYKNADFVNWNKTNLVWCFSLMKNINLFTPESKNLLLSLKYEQNEYKFDPFIFLYNKLPQSTYWYNKITKKQATQTDVQNIITDYFSIAKKMNKKPSLCFCSAKKLKEAHDRLSEEYTGKHTHAIKIPPKTQFAELRKILPKEFEWIKTKQRLVHEGSYMHHCVATYDTKINADQCAIYSVINPADEKRYTIEFCKSNRKYYIRQIYGVWNSICPKEFIEYINSLIRNAK